MASGRALAAACADVVAAVDALNGCLAADPDVPPQHAAALAAAAVAAGDLHGLLKGLLAQAEDVRLREVGGWVLVDTSDGAKPDAAPRMPKAWAPPLVPKSAQDILLLLNHRVGSEDPETPSEATSPGPSGSAGGDSVLRKSFARGDSIYYGLGGPDGGEVATVGDDGSGTGGPSPSTDRSETSSSLSDLFSSGQGALVKTLKNDEWEGFLGRLAAAPGGGGGGCRTATSLVPPGGRHMRLFGTESARACGLVWDRHRLDLAGCWAWPSGYYAKTEFNIDARGRLKNGRQDALVTVADLVAANATFTAPHPYNEVYTDVTVGALAAVFCRTLQLQHLVFCMGVRDLTARATGRRLPLLVLDPSHGVRAFTDHHQLQVLRTCLGDPRPLPLLGAGPGAFLDLAPFPSLSADDTVTFHGLYGCTEACLRRALAAAPDDLPRLLALGLDHALLVDNALAAAELVKLAIPLLVKGPGTAMVADAAPQLQALCLRALSTEMLVPLGACTALCCFLGGVSRARTEEACQVLEDWVAHASSLTYRVQSWKELSDRLSDDSGNASNMTAFLGQKAVNNRTAFLHALRQDLTHAQNPVQYFMRLCSLLAPLHNPCLRLELLQYITGLHSRFTVQTLKRTAEFAFQCLAAPSAA